MAQRHRRGGGGMDSFAASMTTTARLGLRRGRLEATGDKKKLASLVRCGHQGCLQRRSGSFLQEEIWQCGGLVPTGTRPVTRQEKGETKRKRSCSLCMYAVQVVLYSQLGKFMTSHETTGMAEQRTCKLVVTRVRVVVVTTVVMVRGETLWWWLSGAGVGVSRGLLGPCPCDIARPVNERQNCCSGRTREGTRRKERTRRK